jgi:acetyltransferase-like isoleucine patch superfamily enzyme
VKEIRATVWVSDRARIGEGVWLGANVRVWGPATVGDGCVLEDSVQIGHPSPSELRSVDVRKRSFPGRLEDLDYLVHEATSIGDRAFLRSGTVIYSGSRTGPRLDCGHYVLIRENCTLGEDVYARSFAEIRSGVSIGNQSVIAGFVADRSRLGSNVTSLGRLLHKYAHGRRGEIEGAPTLEDGAFVGDTALVIGPVTIGRRAYVAAGAVVTRDVQSRALILGTEGRAFPGESPIGQGGRPQ